MKIFALLLFIIFPLFCFAQEENLSGWHLSLGGGPLTPFRSIPPEPNTVYTSTKNTAGGFLTGMWVTRDLAVKLTSLRAGLVYSKTWLKTETRTSSGIPFAPSVVENAKYIEKGISVPISLQRYLLKRKKIALYLAPTVSFKMNVAAKTISQGGISIFRSTDEAKVDPYYTYAVNPGLGAGFEVMLGKNLNLLGEPMITLDMPLQASNADFNKNLLFPFGLKIDF